MLYRSLISPPTQFLKRTLVSVQKETITSAGTLSLQQQWDNKINWVRENPTIFRLNPKSDPPLEVLSGEDTACFTDDKFSHSVSVKKTQNSLLDPLRVVANVSLIYDSPR